jgi:subtilase family serine protease
MRFSNRRSFFAHPRGTTYGGNKSARRRNRRDSNLIQQPTLCNPSIEVLESRQMLSAAAAFEPAIVVAGRVATPGGKTGGISPATLASAPYTPAQMTTAYGVNLISFGGVTGNGAGQTIAIVDAFNDPNIVADAAAFNTQFNLPQFNVAGGPTFQVLGQTGTTTLPTINGQGWDLEESLDVQWAHSIAPQANIILYESNTNNDSDMDAAVATAAANPAVSVVSMSWGEGEFQGEQSEDPFVLTPTGRTGGVTFLAATGDWNSPAIYPAFSPDVVAVGGTSLSIQTDGTYTSETVWSHSGYGTGGGISQDESLPSYQDGLNGINGASTTNRNVPDVSMDADPSTGVYVLDTYGGGGWYQVGGTSLATPLFAGLVAIANQGRALNGQPSLNGLTQTLPTLYNLPSSDFHDITVGGNGTYNAAPGYDLVSGIGTPIANLLVPDLANSNLNWSPTVSGPSAATTNENTPLDFSGPNAITLTDQIAGTNIDSLTLSVNDGSLTLGSTNGLTFTSGANGSGSMTVSGTIGDIQAAVSGMTYSPNTGYTGSDSLSVLLSDPLANVSASTTVALTINAPPTLTAPTTGSLSENGSLVFSTSNNNAISFTDAAAGAGADSLTLSVTNGTLTLASTSGLTFTTGTNGTASFTVTGTVADLDNSLDGLVYQPTALYVGSDTLSISVTDPADNLSSSTSVALTVNALAPPAITAPSTASLSENGSLVFSSANGNAISFTDAGAGSNPDSLTLSVLHGTLTLSSTSGLTFTGTNGTASFTVSGTVTNLDAALSGLTYQPKSGYIGSDSLAVSVADAGDTLSASTSVALTINILTPTITAPATGSLNENSSLVFSSANSNAISFTDANAGTSKTESLSLSVGHGILTLGSTTGLTYTSGKNNTASITVTGTVANLNAALAGLTYKPTAAYWGSDSLAISVLDPGDKQSSSTSVALTINALSPPTITAPTSATLGENLSVSFSTTNSNAITVADANDVTGDVLTLSVTNGTLTLGATPGLTFKSGTNGTASFSIAATLANLNKAINGLTYKPTSSYSGSDTLSILMSNAGDGQSASTSVALTVTPAVAPVLTAPATASLNENASQVFSAANSNSISFTDVNAGTSKTESVTLSVAHGTLKLGTTYGLVFTAGTNSSASMTVTGTVTNLNAALNGLTYKPTTGYSGSDSLSVSVADPGDGLSASTSVALTVNTLPPAFTAPATATVAVNGSLVFSKTNSNLISVADVNAGSAVEQLTLTATNGKLKLGSTTGITFSSGANNTATMTINGTLTNLNNALKNLTFTPTSGYSGSASISLSYADAGNGLTTSTSIAITVGSGAASQGGSTTSPQTAVAISSSNPGSSSDESTDPQWAGFAAALATLNS